VTKRNHPPTEDEIREAISAAGSITAAAAVLGVTRQTLHRWLRDMAIKVERRTEAA